MRWLPSLGRRSEVKGAIDRRHSAGPYYAFPGVPYEQPLRDMDVDTAVTDAWGRDVWVYRAIHARATNASRIDVRINDGRGKGAREIENHPLSMLLNRRANKYETGQAFRYRLHTLLDLSKKGVPVEVIERRDGETESLHILNPKWTWPVPDPDVFVEEFLMRLPSGEEFHIPPYQRGRGGVLWIKRPHPTDPYSSSTWLEATGISIDLDHYARVYNRNFLYNDGRPGGVLMVKGEDGVDPADAAELGRWLSGGPGMAGRVRVMEGDGLDYVDMSTNPRDAQYVEGRSITKAEILGGAGTPESLWNASGRCVDDRTEALTTHGWVNGVDLTTEDTILAMDPADGVLKWSPIREVYRRNYRGDMFRLRYIGAVVSPGHKWVVEPRTAWQKTLAGTDKFTRVTVEDLVTHDRIITMGDPERGADDPEFTDAFVELVGWAVTEGHYSGSESAPYVRIRQNPGANADRIERCAKEAGATYIARVTDDGRRTLLSIRGEIAAALVAVAPEKILTRDFILALTAAQRELLLQTLIDADGCRQASTASWTFAQKDERASEAFAFLATLCGYTSSLRRREYDYTHKGTTVRKSDSIVVVRRQKATSIQHGGRTTEPYEGLIWCPRTDYGTFVARRDGKVFVTSNTFDNADAEYEGFWRNEMVPELELVGSFWEELTQGGPVDDSEVVTYAYDTVSVLQRDARADEARVQAEWDKGLVTADEYRDRTGKDPLDVAGSRVLWLAAGKAPVGDPDDVAELTGAPPPGSAPPPPEQQPALPPGGAPNALPAGTGVQAPPTLGQGQVIQGEVVPATKSILDEAGYAEKALGSLPKDLVEQRRRDHAALLDDWETRLARELLGVWRRQEQVVLTRLGGTKARKHTRHWEYGPGGARHEVKALDPTYVVERMRWAEEVVKAIADVVKAAFLAAGRATLAALGLGGAPEYDDDSRRIVATTVRSIAEGFDARAGRLQKIIADQEAAGAPLADIVTAVRQAYQNPDTWATVTSREVVGAMNAASLIGAIQAGAVRKRWLATDDERTRPTHTAAEGQVQEIGHAFHVGEAHLSFPGDPGGPLEEVANCLVGGTPVRPRGALRGAFKSWWDGEMVTIRSASGRVITGTPNHPVLTDRGWVGLGLLHVGDHLVCGGVSDAANPVSAPDVEDAPAAIGEVFDSLAQSRQVHRMVAASVNFHGDRPASDVEVVRADRLLGNGIESRGQHRGQEELLAVSHVPQTGLPASGTRGQLLGGDETPPGGVVGGAGEPLALGEIGLRHTHRHGVPSATAGDAHLQQGPADYRTTHAHGPGQRLFGLAAQIPGRDRVEIEGNVPGVGWSLSAARAELLPAVAEEAVDPGGGEANSVGDLLDGLPDVVTLDEVAEIDRRAFSGHVYTLETSSGMFLASDIITRNCRCTMLFQLGARDYGAELDEDLARLDEQEAQWKGLSVGAGPYGDDMDWDPAKHPRDWRGRWANVDGEKGRRFSEAQHPRDREGQFAKVRAERAAQTVGDVVGSLNGEPLAHVSHVENGVGFVQHRDDQWALTGEQAAQIAAPIAEVQDQLPGMIPAHVSLYGDPEQETALATAGGWPHVGITVARILTDDEFLRRYAKEWEGISVAGTTQDPADTRRSVLIHEQGHNVQRAIEHASPEAKAEVDGFVSEMVSGRDLGYSYGDALDTLRPRWQYDALRTADGTPQSVYANENTREWFAEAFADGWLHGDEASESGKRAVAMARRWLGGKP